jgi:DNA-binding transcriptional regulator LsrR (DeoR family)/DNA-binding XRE family transcriptional regulator
MEGPMSAEQPLQPRASTARARGRTRAPRAEAGVTPEHVLALSKRLRELRGAEKKARLAKALNVAESTYASWEDGVLAPRLDGLLLLANHFGVSLDYLLGRGEATPQGFSEGAVTWRLAWSRPSAGRQRGAAIWHRLVAGESRKAIADALGIQDVDVERSVQDFVLGGSLLVEAVAPNEGLATAVRQRFTHAPEPPYLRDVLVADLGNVEWSFVRYVLLGYLAKRYFCQEVRPGTAVGLCGGFAVSRLVHALERGECPEGIRVSPIAVSPVFEKAGVSANSVVSALAYRHWDNRETRDHRNQWAVQASELSFVFKDRVLDDTSPPSRIIRRMLTDAEQVDYVFMGVGSPETGALTRKLYDLQHDYQWIAGINEDIPKIKDGGQAVGDILYHLVDAEGRALPHFERRNKQLVCSIGLDGLKKLVEAGKRVVVIAAGHEKAAVTRAAIRGRYANVLIVDDELARALLQTSAS